MNRIVLDADLRARLGNVAAKLTLTDEAGKPVGHYLPDDLYRGIVACLLPDEADPPAAARDEFARGESLSGGELLARLSESVGRWEGRP